jgi:hypothetical protein
MDSTLLGKKGNKEMLVGLKKDGGQSTEGNEPNGRNAPLI